MTPERFLHIRRVFESVVDLTPEERDARLRDTRAHDPTLVAEVQELVSAFERRAGFIEQPLARVQKFISLAERERNVVETAVGPYRLVELIGRGGMGEVWSAEQTAPVRRRVAVKLIKAGMDTREVVARFESERQALALMDHPAIAKVFDAGSTPQGKPYFAMEYVAGVPITRYCDEHRLAIRERLRLFVRVCEGVQHAHQKAIIHRDLKPSNVLITEVDGKPVPKIIDFGVAKAVSQRLTDDTMFTLAGAVLGTPDYMSPEQANSAGKDIDTRTDVYALGVILYELLVGERPFDFRSLGLGEVLEKLRHSEAPRPSTKSGTPDTLAANAHNRRAEPEALLRQLRGDLDAITLKALEKDRSRRYGTPSELATDIGRYLKNEPVNARHATFFYQAQKYVRRHSGSVLAVAALISLLAAFGVAEAVQLRRIMRERDRADRIATFTTNMFRVSNPSESKGNGITAREILDKGSRDVATGLAKDPELQAQLMEVMGTEYYNLGLYSRAESLLRNAFQIRRRTLGAEDSLTVESENSLANALNSAGRHAEAEKLDRETLAIRRRTVGPNDPATLQSMSNIAVALVDEGHYVEAEQIHRTVFNMRRQVLGPEHPDTLNSLDNLGSTLEREGHFAEAEGLEREALEIKRRVLGPVHPETLRVAHHFADTLYDEGRFSEAEKLHLQELSDCRRVLGPEHPDTLNSMLAVANALEGQERYGEAERLIRDAVEIQRRTLGPEHPDTLLAMNNLAEILGEEGRYQQSAELHAQVIRVRSRVLGTDHPYTLYSQSRLAWVLILSGQLDAAEKLSRDTHEAQLRVLGSKHPDTADTTYNLACIAAQRHQAAEALAGLHDAVDHGLKPSKALVIDRDPVLKSLAGDPRFMSLASYASECAKLEIGPH